MPSSYLNNISHKTGHVANGLYVCGLTWSPVFLLSSSRPVIFESGFACAAGVYERHLVELLDSSFPEALFLTHSHWDHCGTAAYFKARFPGLRIAASPETESIVSRPSAQKLMTELGTTVIDTLRTLLEAEDARWLADRPFQPFKVDVPLQDGQVIRTAPDVTVQAFHTPGHTRDHTSFYIPERKILVGGEAPGCLEPLGGIKVEFLVDYDAYLKSIRRLATLPAEVFCLGHHFVLLGEEAIKHFFNQSIEATERFAERLHALLDKEEDDVDRVLELLSDEYLITAPGLQQPVDSYLVNLRAQISHLKLRRQGTRRIL